MNHWDERFIELAKLVASWSKDRSTKVGAVIVGPEKTILSVGYNGFPRKVDDNIEERHQRPIKYFWTEHAERNAIYNCARNGVKIEGATMYLHWFPCVDCARAIIQSGISTLVCIQPDFSQEKWGEEFKISLEMLEEAKVVIKYFEES